MKKINVIVNVLLFLLIVSLVGCARNIQLDIEEDKIDFESMRIPFELKNENIIEEEFEYDSSYLNKSKKVIEYSLQNEMLSSPLYFGYIEGVGYYDGTKKTMYIIEYNSKIVVEFGGEYIDANAFDWKDAILMIDLDKSDFYIEMFLNIENVIENSLYRIGINDFIHMGYTGDLPKFDIENNRIYSERSYIPFIEEKVLTGYYEIIDNKLTSINIYTTNESYAELSKNVYTIKRPIYIWEDEYGFVGGNRMIESGEKIKIIEILYELDSILYWDIKVERENGEVVIVTTMVGNRT